MTDQKFYYCGLNLLKPSTKREYVDVFFSEPERLLQTTYPFLSAAQSDEPRSYYGSLQESSKLTN